LTPGVCLKLFRESHSHIRFTPSTFAFRLSASSSRTTWNNRNAVCASTMLRYWRFHLCKEGLVRFAQKFVDRCRCIASAVIGWRNIPALVTLLANQPPPRRSMIRSSGAQSANCNSQRISYRHRVTKSTGNDTTWW